MPAGTYRVFDEDGNAVGTEQFRCAPGPSGWRYFSTVATELPTPHTEQIDLTVRAGWIPVRVRIDSGKHQIVLRFGTGAPSGVRDGEPIQIPWNDDMHIDYFSPCFHAVTANRLGGSADIDVLCLDPVTCAPRAVRRRWEALGEERVHTEAGTFSARRWRYAPLPDGRARDLWIAGDVVVRLEDVFELIQYEALSSGVRPIT